MVYEEVAFVLVFYAFCISLIIFIDTFRVEILQVFAWLQVNKLKILKYVIALIVAIVWLLPFLGVFMASIRPLGEITRGWWNFDRFTPMLDNYVKAWSWSGAPMGRCLLNSLIVTASSTIMVTLLGLMVAYPVARFKFFGRKILFFFMILIMAAPPELIIMSNYKTLMGLGLLDTFLGLILIHVAWGLGWIVLFLRNYMLSIPLELEEAARTDGASHYQVLFKVIFPMMLPALASVAVIQFTWTWNALLFPLVFIRTPSNYMVTQAIPIIKGRFLVNWGGVCAASVMSMAVPVVLFYVLQRYFVRGMTAGYRVG